jgi:DNA/RNA endonuclease YhcR with UshA esterase domain
MVFDQKKESYLVDRGLTPVQQDPITKLKLEGNIVLNDFIFNTIDDEDVVWVITDIDNWWNTTDAEMPDVERGFGDGSYDVQGRYKSRKLTLKGSFLVPNASRVEAARDRLVAAADLVYKGAWLKTGTNPIRASWVRVEGSISFNTNNVRGRTEFSIPLRAADPIKYAWNPADPEGYETIELPIKNATVPGSGIAVVTNIGNYPVPVYLEITGPVQSPATIYNRTTDELIIITQRIKGRLAEALINKQLTFDVASLKDVATITTVKEHSYSPGDVVLITNVGSEFDGERVITSTPTNTTFTFEGEAADIRFVAHKNLTSGIAKLETTTDHGFASGQQVIVNGVDAVFDGSYTITGIPDSKSFTFNRTRIPPASIVSKILVSNIATITTAEPHQFIIGDTVTISDVDINFNGQFPITAINSPTEFSYAATRTNAREVTNRAMSNDIVTLTTATQHGFILNEFVNVTGVGLSFNGGFEIAEIPSATTFRYKRLRSTQRTVFIKSLSSNVATLATQEAHGFLQGERVIVEGVDATFNGTYQITSVPSPNTFTYAKTGANLIATAVTGGTVKARTRQIVQRDLVANLATIVTKAAHGAFVGERVTVSGLGSPFDGTYDVVSVPSANTLTYNKVSPNVPPLNFGTQQQPGPDQPLTNAFVEMLGTVNSAAVSPAGLATVSGSLPFTGATGTASVPADIVRLPAAGRAIKTNNVRFTPGLSGATAILDADILEINTQNREVFFNGFVEGARGKIDVLADFLRLAPGENIIEFEDAGAPEGEGSLKIFYRSGWLA